MKTRQQLLIETHALRQQAAELAAQLEQSQRELTDQLSAEQRQDIMKAVAGRSAIERSLQETRRMIEALDRALEETRAIEAPDRVSPACPPEPGGDASGSTDMAEGAPPESAGGYDAVIARIGLRSSHPAVRAAL